MNTAKRVTEVIAFCSGKGGTGKTSLIAALGYALIYSGHSVLMIDADRATDGFSLFLLGPDGMAQLASFSVQSTFSGVLNSFSKTAQMAPEPHLIHRSGKDDHTLSYKAIISGKGLYGDDSTAIGGTVDDLWNLQFERKVFQAGVRALFDAARGMEPQYDYVLVDSRGGFSFESTDVVAAADSFVVVTEAATTNFYQERNLVDRINSAANAMGTKPLLRGIVVNKSTEYPETSFRHELVREFGIQFEDTFPIKLDVEAVATYKTQKAIYLAAPASHFAYDSLRAFQQILRVVTSQWAEDRAARWNQLVASVDTAIAKHNSEVEQLRKEQEDRVAAYSALVAEREQLSLRVQNLGDAHEQEKHRQDILLEELRGNAKRREEEMEKERIEARSRLDYERSRQDRLIEQLQVRLHETEKEVGETHRQARAQDAQRHQQERELVRQLSEAQTMASELRRSRRRTAIVSAVFAALFTGALAFTFIEFRDMHTKPNAASQQSDANRNAGGGDRRAATAAMPDESQPPTDSGSAPQVDAPEKPEPETGKWFRPCTPGLKNVIVASGFQKLETAQAAYAKISSEFPGFEFEIDELASADGKANRQYAIMAGHALSDAEAARLLADLKETNPKYAKNAYSKAQPESLTCVPEDWAP